ncbi:hypothetical protein K469DRAFT_692433 [Zopfia rhizophila CBS 207.26]|uniref:Amino acid permease/ SLC12A domain-containing protein n=1 Tax=Zopfia rhizophila CBS 207.26 TaxID=1314779 RepID=A0A6A6DSF2_9PEZI|nr:hypothetical protein K469DRAFT_692433 [Zopfia rhizophila CBS 207.26]
MVIILGFSVKGRQNFNKDGAIPTGVNFSPGVTFANAAKAVSSYSSTFLYVLYTYSGFEQPFYVLSEVARPRKNFAKAVLSAIGLLIVLFVLVNIAYLCVIPLEAITNSEYPDADIATLFFEKVFGNDAAKHLMQAMITFSIFGNLIVLTFTAARVKQEIAEEGILPKSLFFASGKSTPTAKLFARWAKKREAKKPPRESPTPFWNASAADVGMVETQEPLEQSPMAALGLHWFSSIFLVAITAKLKPDDSYSFLVSLYAYVIISVMGFFTSLGLLYSKYIRKDFVSQYPVWGGPTAAIIYCFLSPSSSTSSSSAIPWYVVPTIGLSTVLWGVIWWLGLHLVMRQRGQKLEVTRRAFCEMSDENDEWILKYEIIDHVWKAKSDAGSVSTADGKADVSLQT